MALALGMRPAKIYKDRIRLLKVFAGRWKRGKYFVIINRRSRSWKTSCSKILVWKRALLEKKDKYGFWRKNGVYYFKLNAKIGLS